MTLPGSSFPSTFGPLQLCDVEGGERFEFGGELFPEDPTQIPPHLAVLLSRCPLALCGGLCGPAGGFLLHISSPATWLRIKNLSVALTECPCPLKIILGYILGCTNVYHKISLGYWPVWVSKTSHPPKITPRINK